MKEKLSCEIIKDLIPLSSEGLCSEESRAAIEMHIRECESCRRLYVQLPEAEAPEAPVPDEGKAFRKVSKKLKNRLIKMIVLGVILLFVLGGLGYLSVGQVMKSHGQQSFETVWQSIEVRRLARMVAEGDFDSYAEEASAGDLLDSRVDEMDFDTIRAQDKALIQTAWQAAFGGEKVHSIEVQTVYSDSGQKKATAPYSAAFIHYESGRKIQLNFQKEKDGKYSASAPTSFSGECSEAELAFGQALRFMSMRECFPINWYSERLTNKELVTEKENAAQKAEYLTLYFVPDWQDGIEEQMINFYLKGYYITDFTVTGVLYDREKELLYHDVTVEAADGQGSAILLTRFYASADGLSPAPEQNRVFSDGSTDALAADLAALFT